MGKPLLSTEFQCSFFLIQATRHRLNFPVPLLAACAACGTNQETDPKATCDLMLQPWQHVGALGVWLHVLFPSRLSRLFKHCKDHCVSPLLPCLPNMLRHGNQLLQWLWYLTWQVVPWIELCSHKHSKVLHTNLPFGWLTWQHRIQFFWKSRWVLLP